MRLAVAPALAVALLVGVATGDGTPPASAHPAPLHLELESSVPAADSVVTPPSELVLRFSQAPQEDATSVRLVTGGELVETGEVARDAEDSTIYRVPVPAVLGDGAYEVRWRTMAADGHVVRGDYRFTVRAP